MFLIFKEEASSNNSFWGITGYVKESKATKTQAQGYGRFNVCGGGQDCEHTGLDPGLDRYVTTVISY